MKVFGLLLAGVLAAVPVAHAQPTSHFFDSDGVQIHYTDQGTGEPVVLIHGFTMSLDVWEDSGIAPALAASGYRVVSLDLRGHGKSGKPHDRASYGDKVVGDVVALLDHLDIPKAHIVGYSMGAMLTLSLLVDHQGLMRSAVVGGAGVPSPSWAAKFFEPFSSVETFSALLANNAAARARNHDVEAIAAFSQAAPATVLTPATFPQVGVPLAAIVGAEDPSLAFVEQVAELHPATQLTVIPGDHATAFSSPEFTAAVQSFLDEVSGR